MKDLSVIIPVYNSEKYLRECLDSILVQSIDNFEIIIIDDASTDNSLNIIIKYLAKYKDIIKVIKNPINRDLSYSRNIGLSIAEGRYIAFVDSDDYINQYMFLDMLELAKSMNYPEVISVKHKKVLENEDPYKYIFDEKGSSNIKVINGVKYPSYIHHETPACWNKIFLHETIKNRWFIDRKKWEDISFTYPILLKTKEIVAIDEVYYYYRIHQESGKVASSYFPNLDILDIFDVCNEIKRQTIIDGTYQNAKDEIKKLQISSCLNRIKEILKWEVNEDVKREIIRDFNSLINYYYGSYGTDDLELKDILDYKVPKIVNPNDIKTKVLTNIREVMTK